MKVVQAYRFALDPSPAQERMLRSHAGAARFAWNWGLAKCKERYAAERKWYSAVDLHKLWNGQKKADPGLAWWAENSKCAYQEAFRNLDRALRDYVKSSKGGRKGRRLGFPKFKKRGKSRDSFRLTGAIRCDRATVTLPRLGTIRTHEPVSKLARKLADGSARILSATVSRTAQRWFVSFAVEVERKDPRQHARPGSVVGLDLGVKTLLTGIDDRGRLITVAGPEAAAGQPAEAAPGIPRALPQTPRLSRPAQERRAAGPPPRPHRQPPRGRAAQGDHRAGGPARDGGGGGPERHRDDRQPQARPGDL